MKHLRIPLLLLFVAVSQVRADAPRPNILVIFSDDQSYKTVGCYPEAPSWVKTPQIDALASSGVRFERAYLGAWCMPSRASMLTGRLAHGVESMRMEGTYPGSTYHPDKTPFWPAVFRQKGYTTAHIGKWHTGIDTGWNRDWDHQIVWNRPKLPENAGNYYSAQILSFDGIEHPHPQDGYSTDNYTQWAEKFINGEGRDPKKPWYLWLCYGAIHGPTTPAERHLSDYKEAVPTIPQDVFGPRPGKPKYLKTTQAWIPSADGKPALKKKPKQAGNYDRDEPGLSLEKWIIQMNQCAEAIDEGVGRLISALKTSGQLENTMVIYVADQGYAMGEHGLNMKLAPYDASYASPLIISQPGTIPQGKVCHQPVNSPDIVTTIAARAGISIPWKMHGKDLSPLLDNPQRTDWDHPVLMTFTGASYGSDARVRPSGEVYHDVPWWIMLRHHQFKYIRYLIPGETEELYDLKSDPEELDNLASQAEKSELLKSMRGQAIDELRKTDAPFVDELPRTLQEETL